MRRVRDHKEETRSHTSTQPGPAAPATCASGPFSCCQAACTSWGCEIGHFRTGAVEARLGLARLLFCFITVNPELAQLESACSTLILCFQRHLQNTGPQHKVLTPLQTSQKLLFSALRLCGKSCVRSKSVRRTELFLQGPFCLLKGYTYK